MQFSYDGRPQQLHERVREMTQSDWSDSVGSYKF